MSLRSCRVYDGVEIVPGGAAHLTEENVLVVADLHLGCEAVLEGQGLSIPRVQTTRIEQYLVDVLDEFKPTRLIVAGDLKHNFSRNLAQEWQDVDRFVRLLSGRVQLQVVKGNHDNYLGAILSRYDIPLLKEARLSGIRVLHGHSGNLSDGFTVMGHVHPSIRLKDGVGASLKDRCFLLEEDRRILILPALSLVSPGTDVIGQLWPDRVSPLLGEAGLAEFKPIAFSGRRPLFFPTVRELREVNGMQSR